MIFSIIVPIYNVEKYLEKCINSLLMQNIDNYEIILINDGSTDNSYNICLKYKKNKKIILINKINTGLSDTRNYGISIAKGEYIIFVDSDDWIRENCLLQIEQSLIKSPEILICNYINYDDNSKIYTDNDETNVKKSDFDNAKNKIEYFKSCSICDIACRIIIKKSFLIKNKLFFINGIRHEDNDWVPMVFCLSKVIDVFENPFYFYRKRENSITTNRSIQNVLDLIIIIDRLSTFQIQQNDTINKDYIQSCLFKYLFSVCLHSTKLSKEDQQRIFLLIDDKISIFKYNLKVYIFVKIFGMFKGVIFYKNLIDLKDIKWFFVK